MQRLESALADAFPCTFLGETTIRELELVKPIDGAEGNVGGFVVFQIA